MIRHPLYKNFSQSIFARLGNNERGVVAVLFVTIILLIALGLTISVVPTFTNTIQTLKDTSYSQQAYYAAESGIEDAAYRITNAVAYPASYTLSVGQGQTTVTVATVGSSQTIESDGVQQSRIRKVQSNLSISSSQVAFNFALQVGTQGVTMGDGSSIVGNIFSNGNINGPGESKGTITGTAQAAGSSTIQNITVQGDAYANTLSNCAVGGAANYFTSVSSCSFSSSQKMSSQISSQAFPITQSQIDEWENDATAGGTLSSYTLGNNTSGTLGPEKIAGDITLGNGSTLTLTGTVWVTGTINFGNSDIIQLASGYGTASGVLIVDGTLNAGNGVIMRGSGQTGSDLMVLDTASSLSIGNTGQADIFYAPNGTVNINNGANFKEITANGLNLGNNVTITYQTGLSNLNFTSGPGGSWQLNSWQEIP